MQSLLPRAFALLVVSLSATAAQPALALSAKQCSAQYDAAKSAGTLGGANYSTYRRDKCDADEDARSAPIQFAAADQPTGSSAVATTAPVFPKAVSPQHAAEAPGAARRHTCSDQYQANKATGANGGLKWLQKGGGYYSQCNKRLKGG